MTFDYNTLKRAARDGSRLGNWNGKAVFAASANDLENKGSGAYYILYDDENKIVSRSAANNGWKSFGEVTTQGSVNEYSSARNYKTPAEAAEAARKASSRASTFSKKFKILSSIVSASFPLVKVSIRLFTFFSLHNVIIKRMIVIKHTTARAIAAPNTNCSCVKLIIVYPPILHS